MKRAYDAMSTHSRYNTEKPTYKEWFGLGDIFFKKENMEQALKYYKQAEDYYRKEHSEDSSDVYMLARIKSGICKTKAAIYSYMHPEELTDLSINGEITIKTDDI